ncbi:MAG: M6 family metalloprotease domain-containing protein, partial [Candidatus Latescibacteria bacterium]|nr:M6 family metalloprotease domain-containing protein [Candidatus Latescibacterota bacterium]
MRHQIVAVGLPALAAMLFLAAPRSEAVTVAPSVRASAKTAAEQELLSRAIERYETSRAWGVDRVYPKFTLNLAKYPRGGVAHRNLLVVLCDFDADAFGGAVHHDSKSTPGYFHNLFFSDDPNDGVISLREYYKMNSHGRLIISGRVTSEWLVMPRSYAYYTNNNSGLDFSAYPRSAQGLAEDAMIAAYGSFGNNLSYFDNDGPDGIPSSGDDDGYVDAVCVIHPGQGAEVAPIPAEPFTLWSHEAGINVYEDCPMPSSPNCLPGMFLGGVRGFLYFMVGEFNWAPGDDANGTYIHEFGHTLGLPDLYEFSLCNASVGAGLGVFSLMSLGNYLPLSPTSEQGRRPGNLDAWCRQFLGFEQPAVVPGSGSYSLPPLTRGGSAVKVWKDGRPGTEYFLVENRIHEGSDEYIPGEGLLVYHVDDTLIDNCRDCDNASCLDPPAPHYRVALVQADGLNELLSPSGDLGDGADPFPGILAKRSWTDVTTPNSRDYAGADTGIRMTNIVGAYDGADTASFDLSVSVTPRLLVKSVLVQDGGGNGSPDNGETDSLDVTLENAGAASGALSLTLSTADPGITVDVAAASAPAAGAGATVSAATPFVFTVGTYATLPHAVTFTLGWNDGTSSGSEDFTLTVGMGSSLAADFESGVGSWTSAPVAPTSIDEWHLSTTRAHGGLSSMKVGSILDPAGSGSNGAKSYARLQDAALVSPMFDLEPGSQLAFYSWIDAQTNGGTGCWDGGRVEISLRGGPWIPLAVDDGYGYQIEFNSAASLRDSDVFSGSPQRWRRVVADLTGYSGPAQIRFRFSSDDDRFAPVFSGGSLARTYEGWYVDDVLVGPRVDPGPTPRPLSLRAGPNPFRVNRGFAATITFRFSAPDGLPHTELSPRVRLYDL